MKIKYLVKDFLQMTSKKHFVWRRRDFSDVLALTFDDGPDPENTSKIVDILNSFDIKATFFVVGNRAISYPEIIEYIFNAGHEIGNHTFNHNIMPSLSFMQKKKEVVKSQKAIYNICGGKTFLFRPPETRIDISSLLSLWILRQYVIFWSISAEDYKRDGVKLILDRVNRNTVSAGDILSFHDDSRDTVEALPYILDDLKSAGYKFDIVSKFIK